MIGQRIPGLIEALELLLLDSAARNLSARTIDTYAQKLGAFVVYCEAQHVTTLDAVTPSLIRQYFTDSLDRRLSAHTVRSDHRHLRLFFNFCVREEFISKSPARNVRPPKTDKPDPQTYTPKQLHQILDAAQTVRDRAIVLLLLDTGLRISELVALNADDVELRSGGVFVARGKGGKSRTLHASPITCREIARYYVDRGRPAAGTAIWLSKRGGRLRRRAVSNMLNRIGGRVGFRVVAHGFRRTFATECLRNGWDIYTLADAMGHADITVLKHYLQIVHDDVRRRAQQSSVVETMLHK